MSLALLELAELDPSSSTPGLVHAAYSRYETDVFTLFQLFASGDRAAAHEWDEQQVDPSYNALLDLLFEAGRKYAAEADRANLIAAGGSVLTMLAAGMLTAIAFWYAQRTRRAFECELARRAFHDALTGLPNRAQFGDHLSAALAVAATRNERLAVLFVDVDAFKLVNDDLGHAAGDQLLVQVAQRLGGVLRTGDMAARLGGDEFTLLLQPPIQQVDAEHVAQRIIDTLRAPFRLAGREARVTVSVGIALSGGRAAAVERAEDLVRRADHAMYLSKRRGKGHWEVAEAARADQTAA
jgi:diguanylate cyclase (GGDEF)-like protein